MLYVLEINTNGGSKRGRVISCPSINKNIISPLPRCLWPPNIGGGDLP